MKANTAIPASQLDLLDLLKRYQTMQDGLSEMVESGVITQETIQDKYQWLVEEVLVPLANHPGHEVVSRLLREETQPPIPENLNPEVHDLWLTLEPLNTHSVINALNKKCDIHTFLGCGRMGANISSSKAIGYVTQRGARQGDNRFASFHHDHEVVTIDDWGNLITLEIRV